jgi:hypothetical protein
LAIKVALGSQDLKSAVDEANYAAGVRFTEERNHLKSLSRCIEDRNTNLSRLAAKGIREIATPIQDFANRALVRSDCTKHRRALSR